MITIYHNPRCSKSRECMQLLELQDKPFTTVKYITEQLTKEELTDIINKLNIKPIELIRQKEDIWIQNYKGKDLTDGKVIDIMLQYPNLIERPIVINGDKAVIARPAERINEIL